MWTEPARSPFFWQMQVQRPVQVPGGCRAQVLTEEAEDSTPKGLVWRVKGLVVTEGAPGPRMIPSDYGIMRGAGVCTHSRKTLTQNPLSHR